jgi:geranylgeranylglycerol-phosphate geranylgeranyltransferase
MLARTVSFLWNRVEITRPHNLTVAAATILVGWAVAGGGGDGFRLAVAVVAGAVVTAAGNVVNDYFDADIDRINKPRRPIPSGRMTRAASWRYYWVLNALAATIALAGGAKVLAAIAVWTLCLYLYSAKLKTRFLLGNLMVSAVSSSGFVLGAWLAANPVAALVPACLAFLFIMGREIVKDVEDLPGDRACGATTLAHELGARRALRVALGFFVVFVAAVPLPYWLRLYGPPYILTYALGVVPLLAFAARRMLRDESPGNLLRVSWILNLDMLLGVIGFYLGNAR